MEHLEELVGLEAGLAAGVEGALQELFDSFSFELGLILHSVAHVWLDGRVERVEVEAGGVEAVFRRVVGIKWEPVEEQLDDRDCQRENVVGAELLASRAGTFLRFLLPDVGRRVVVRQDRNSQACRLALGSADSV